MCSVAPRLGAIKSDAECGVEVTIAIQEVAPNSDESREIATAVRVGTNMADSRGVDAAQPQP